MVTTIMFDCDGVLSDTERYGHLPAFNKTFEDYGLPVHWNEDEYAKRLRISGGKERMASLFGDGDFVRCAAIPDSEEERTELLASWHKTKTDTFKAMVARGELPPRPGVARIITEAIAAGWTVAVASTSAFDSVRAVLSSVVGKDVAASIPIFAGDVVSAKKPDPAVYLLAIEQLGVDISDALVIEDSRNGMLAAVSAGLPCLVTVNNYTHDEDFSEAALVVSELGDPGRSDVEVLADRAGVNIGAFVTLNDISLCIEHSRDQRLR